MNIQYIVSKALVDYDSVQPVIRYLNKETDRWSTNPELDTERSYFTFKKKGSDDVIIRTEYEVLGIFYNKLNVWSWAWSHPGLSNTQSYLSKEILLYGLKLGPDLSYLKSTLITSRGLIKEKAQLDIHLALGASIIKQPYIYPYVYPVGDYELIYYMILLNKDELDKLQEKIIKEGDVPMEDMVE